MSPNSSKNIGSDLHTMVLPNGDVGLDLGDLYRARDDLLSESSLGQLAVTSWISTALSKAKLALYGDRTPVSQLQQLMETHPGKLLALLPIGRIAETPRQAAAILRNNFIQRQADWPGLPVDPSTALYCVDGHPFGLPRQLYSPDAKALVDWHGFRSVVSGLIGTIGTNRSLSGQLSKRADSIANILFELFKNTHDHARTSASHELLGYSIRGVYARYYDSAHLWEQFPRTRDELISMNLNPAQAYAWSVMQPETGRTHRQPGLIVDGLLELSVFDSGPGLAARWHGSDTRHLDVSTELDFVLSCLTKGSSTSNRPARGFGLWNVLQELRALRGFIRIRTNRVHGYREFNVQRDAALKTRGDLMGTPEEVLFDWKKLVVTTPSEYPNVAGTLISVLLPLSAGA